MPSWNLQSKNLIALTPLAQETLTIPASTSAYTKAFVATHLDSIYGIFIRLAGIITGAGAVTVQLETSISYGADASWAAAGDVYTYTGTDMTQLVVPTAGKPIGPHCRVKISVAAATSVVFTKAQHTNRGLN